jgi:hypothetical protein
MRQVLQVLLLLLMRQLASALTGSVGRQSAAQGELAEKAQSVLLHGQTRLLCAGSTSWGWR